MPRWPDLPAVRAAVCSGACLVGLLLAAALPASAATGGRWTREFAQPWFDGNIDVVATWRGDVLIAGDFGWLAGRPLESPAIWDGQTWETLGGGVNGTIEVIYENYGGDLWIGGDFTHAGGVEVNGIARWDGEWHAAGAGFDGVVHDIVRWEGGIVAVGEFVSAGEDSSENVSFWDGLEWSVIGGGWLRNGAVLAVEVFEGKLIFGGEFGYGNGVAFWDGIDWSLPGGWALYSCDTSGYSAVRDIGLIGNWLYIVGDFRAPPQSARNIARFVGNGWTTVGTEFDDCRSITDFDPFSGYVWVVAEGELWTLRTSGWFQVDTGPHTRVNAVAASRGYLYVGGDRGGAGDVTQLPLTLDWTYTRPDWETGFQGAVTCLIPWEDAVVAGGSFAGVDGVSAERIAMRTGSTWQALGEGLNDTVDCLAVHEGELMAGGRFNGSGTSTLARRVARWDGAAWTTLGAGFSDGSVAKLLSTTRELLAIGSFTATAGVPLRGVAAWSNPAWVQKGSTLLGVNDVAEVNGDLLVAGTGDLPDGGKYLGRWDGADWESFPGGEPGSSVRVLGTYRGDLVIGGDFQAVGGIPARRVARWTGSEWQALGGGANARVNRFAEYAGQLYAAGDFAEVDGRSAARVARWDGTSWWPLGAGLHGAAFTFLPQENRLWVAGAFTRAGGFPVPRIAAWTQAVSAPAPDFIPGVNPAAGPAPVVLRAWPNPAAASAEQSIEFTLPAAADVTLTVHDVAGRLVRTVTARGLPAGHGEVRWDGRDEAGRRAAGGVYFVRLRAAGVAVTHKIVRVD